MTDRQEVELVFRVGDRKVTVKAMDTVGVEDIYDVQFRAVLHRYVTGEDIWRPVPREAKDFILKLNLSI